MIGIDGTVIVGDFIFCCWCVKVVTLLSCSELVHVHVHVHVVS